MEKALPPLPACVSQMREARFAFEGRMGRRPEALYLGRKDEQELRAWVQPFLHADSSEKVDRARFDDIPIFVVDAERHVGVG